MIKIVRIITRLNIGGPAIHVVLLSSELNRAGYKDILVCGRTSEAEGDMLYYAKANGVIPLCVNDLGRDISIWKDLKAFFAILSIIKRERPDIVHTHTAKAGTLGRLAAIIAGVPVKVHTFHGHVFDGYFNPAKTWIFLFIERLLARFTDKLVVVSKIVKDELVHKLRIMEEDKGVVVPLGLELDRFIGCDARKGYLRARIKSGNDTLLVGIVGRLVPIKNHKMFLDVARLIRKKSGNMKVNFLIIGDGESREALKEDVRINGLEDVVEFTGWIEDLAGVYADLDVVCLTSLNEGTPVSLIEAMASGRSVIATDVGGVRDLITDGVSGVLVRSGDVNCFADKLFGLLKDASRRRDLGKMGRDAVIGRYSKERLVRDIEKLYADCIEKKANR